jgi:hypothetical protein
MEWGQPQEGTGKQESKVLSLQIMVDPGHFTCFQDSFLQFSVLL